MDDQHAGISRPDSGIPEASNGGRRRGSPARAFPLPGDHGRPRLFRSPRTPREDARVAPCTRTCRILWCLSVADCGRGCRESRRRHGAHGLTADGLDWRAPNRATPASARRPRLLQVDRPGPLSPSDCPLPTAQRSDLLGDNIAARTPFAIISPLGSDHRGRPWPGLADDWSQQTHFVYRTGRTFDLAPGRGRYAQVRPAEKAASRAGSGLPTSEPQDRHTWPAASDPAPPTAPLDHGSAMVARMRRTTGVDQSGSSITVPSSVHFGSAPKARSNLVTGALSAARWVRIRLAGRGRWAASR